MRGIRTDVAQNIGISVEEVEELGIKPPNIPVDEKTVTLQQVAPPPEGKKFQYIYDFGDSWDHDIIVEKIMPTDPKIEYPICIKGKRACPPEDCGGIGGYKDFLEAIADPKNPEHESAKEWVGGEFDPEAFDLEETNEVLGDLEIWVELNESPEEMEALFDIAAVGETAREQIVALVEEVKAQPDGYSLRFPNDPLAYTNIVQIIPVVMILQLPIKFVLEIDPPTTGGPIWLRILGPKDEVEKLLDRWKIDF